MPTAAELVAQLNALPAEEHAEALALLSNDSGAVVKAFRSKQFAAGKREGASVGTEAATKLADAEQRVADLETELADVKAKQPDAAAIEERAAKQWQRKVDAEKARADAATTALTGERTTTFREQFGKALRDLKIDGDYADEVLTARHADRHRVREDGTREVLRPGEDTAYEAADVRAAIALLAADVAKTVPPKFQMVGGEGGGGRGTGSYGAGASRTVEQIRDQKRAAGIGPSL